MERSRERHPQYHVLGRQRRTFGGKHVSHETSDDGPGLVSHNGQLFIAWRGSGNQALSVAKAALGPAGIQGLANKIVLNQRSDVSPALASKSNRLFLAWKGDGNDKLNVALSEDDGPTFGPPFVSSDQFTDAAPTLAAFNSRLFLGWRGDSNEDVNVAKVGLFGSTTGHIGIEGLEDQDVLQDTTDAGPALALQNGQLYLGWKGSGNDNLNVSYSRSSDLNFVERHVSEEKTEAKPAFATHNSELLIAWKGNVGHGNLNVARVSRYNS